MIIIGYPGIGKSTLAAKDNRYIDLESSCFNVDGKKIDDWYVAYCQVAEHLSRQGYIVFVSSHAAIVDFLCRIHTSKDRLVALIYPSINLRDQWVEKLRQRFVDDGLEKNYQAWARAHDHYKEDVRVLSQAPILSYKLPLTSMDYDLQDEIEKIFDGRL